MQAILGRMTKVNVSDHGSNDDDNDDGKKKKAVLLKAKSTSNTHSKIL